MLQPVTVHTQQNTFRQLLRNGFWVPGINYVAWAYLFFAYVVKVKDSEAYLMTRRLSHKEGLLVGISSGANVCAALKVAENLPKGSRVLTFLCDAGQRYFSLEKYFKT